MRHSLILLFILILSSCGQETSVESEYLAVTEISYSYDGDDEVQLRRIIRWTNEQEVVDSVLVVRRFNDNLLIEESESIIQEGKKIKTSQVVLSYNDFSNVINETTIVDKRIEQISNYTYENGLISEEEHLIPNYPDSIVFLVNEQFEVDTSKVLVKNSYNPQGKLIKSIKTEFEEIQDQLDSIYSADFYTYDEFGNMISRTNTFGGDTLSVTTAEYDKQGNKIFELERVFGFEAGIEYVYDSENKLTQIRDLKTLANSH